MSDFTGDGKDDLQSIIATLRETVGDDHEDDVFDAFPRGQFLDRMDSFARGKNSVIFDEREELFAQEPTFIPKSTSKNVFTNFSSMFDDNDDEITSRKGSLFDSIEDSQKLQARKSYLDFSRDVLGEVHDQLSFDESAGLDKLLEGRPSLRLNVGCGILSEQDLIRTNVLSHRTKEEVAAMLATVTPEVSICPILTIVNSYSLIYWIILLYI